MRPVRDTEGVCNGDREAPSGSMRIVGNVADRPGRRGGDVAVVALRSSRLAIEVLTLGASLVSVVYDPDKEPIELVAALPTWLDYNDQRVNHHVGSTMGRWCRFVTDPVVEIDGQRVRLATTEAGVHAHGGPEGFTYQNWNARLECRAAGTTSAVLRHESPDGHQGYPGAVSVEVEYRLSVDGRLTVGYRASTTAPTLLGLANHVYWRIGEVPVGEHQLLLPAARRLDIVGDLPTTRSPIAVSGLDDFRSARRLGDQSVDAFYVGGGDAAVWRIAAPDVGIALELKSRESGAGIYTGDRDPVPRRGICCQFGPWPAAEHRPDFPSPIVRPGSPYLSSWSLAVRLS